MFLFHKPFKLVKVLNNMRNIFDYFKKKEPEKLIKKVELSKIDKHVNLILREKLSSQNKNVSDSLADFEQIKDRIIHKLKELHKKSLMNPNIPRREIQIMEGNRDNYVKRITQFLTKIVVPKPYLDLYYYTKTFSEDMERLSSDIQKNTFVLRGFFENELKDINKDITSLEQSMINIRVLFEKHNVQKIQDIIDDISRIKSNMNRVIKFNHEIKEHESIISDYQEKIKKLQERIETITSGTDYRALETFKFEKEDIDAKAKKIFSDYDTKISQLNTAMKKYLYKNQDKKIIREYLEEPYKALLNDHALEISNILRDIRENIDDIDLKDKKREHVVDALDKLDFNYLKETQHKLEDLENQKKHIQTKITHNSASLNLSEQQYWMNTNQDKIKTHTTSIIKIQEEHDKFSDENKLLKKLIREELEKMFGENIDLHDDLAENL